MLINQIGMNKKVIKFIGVCVLCIGVISLMVLLVRSIT